MNTYTAELTIVRDDHGERIVVTYADDVIWLSDELMYEATRPDREHIRGDLEIDGDLITFGTPGEGLGRLTYRLTGRHEQASFHIAKREDPTP